ncbi:PAS domain S-box protein [Natronobacterium texcoconense]|uniref:histidine kinase n=1 Tax=Natronobacterium texcoconense TaxID=1095778 RepID=A0A1H1GSD6_NATTX|nr:PAS domain S-box protein [Natronobacterium texcoconense]SDR16059.1 PAS domain S-box-containing protein [Natronobacterium texcoconense]
MSDRPPTAQDPDAFSGLEQYRALADAVGGVYRLDSDGRFTAVDDDVLELTGYDREDLLGEHVSIVVDDRDVDRLEEEIESRFESGERDASFTFGLAIETASGGRVPCELRFSLLADEDEFQGTVGVVDEAVDGSGRAETNLESLWRTYESIASVIDEADVGVFVLDETFDVVWINETIERYFGVDRTEVVGRDKRTLIEESISERFVDSDEFADTVLATYDDNTYVEQFECRITGGDDREERWLEHRSKPIESGRYAGGRIELYYDVTERKESERALRESEQRFRSLVDAVEEYAIFMLDTDGRIVSWNDGAAEIKGYDETDILGDHFSKFYTQSDREAGVPERNLEVARESGAVEDEGWRVRADGSRFWANVTITPIRENGELQGYAKVTRDMTDRREREQKLQRERDLIERILETSPVGIAVVNLDGSTDRANERMAELLDLSPENASEYAAGQQTMYDAEGSPIPIEDRPANRVFETGDPVYDREILLSTEASDRIWVSINATPITDGDGPPEQVVVTATDITDLKELAQRRKRELEEREKELAIVQLATNLIETGDRPVMELLEAFVDELPGSFRYPEQTAARVSVGEHEVVSEAFESYEERVTTVATTDSGTRITIDAVLLESPTGQTTEPFLEEERELIETLATLLKFHFERREYIEELQAETERLEQFAYAASHDLQEPLRMISSYLQLLERRYGEDFDEDGREFLEFAVDGAERMRSMIDGLLTYSRVETQGQPLEPVDLAAVLEDVRSDLELRIAETDAEITVESLPRVEGDASQLRQVFQNLLENALEYSDGTPRVHVSAERHDDEWIISVRDEGIGIDPDERDRIFEVFHRLHGRDEHDGTGIGLALCERIVERHGGEIEVDSEPGEGSTFSVTLPAVENDA